MSWWQQPGNAPTSPDRDLLTMARLDPDRLAELESERDFLLRSLDDLDAEHGVGDLDDVDHDELRDDYTRRAAEVIRAIDEEREAFAAAPTGMSTSQRVMSFVAVVTIAAVAGVLLARAIGFRSPSGELTGGIRQTTAGLLAEADTLTREGRWGEAIDVYDDVLEQSPANLEALTYSGWVTWSQFGDPSGIERILDAQAVDPTYPDALVFGALAARGEGDFEAAAASIAKLDELDELPPQIEQLVVSANLRAEVAAGALAEQAADSGVDVAATGLDLNLAAQGAAILDSQGQLTIALEAFSQVLDQDPENRVALIGLGRRLGATPDIAVQSPASAAEGLALLDRAVGLDADDAEARLWRGIARGTQGDTQGARADLDVLRAVDLGPNFAPLLAELESLSS